MYILYTIIYFLFTGVEIQHPIIGGEYITGVEIQHPIIGGEYVTGFLLFICVEIQPPIIGGEYITVILRNTNTSISV